MGNSIIRFKRKQHFFVVPGLIGGVTFVFFYIYYYYSFTLYCVNSLKKIIFGNQIRNFEVCQFPFDI